MARVVSDNTSMYMLNRAEATHGLSSKPLELNSGVVAVIVVVAVVMNRVI